MCVCACVCVVLYICLCTHAHVTCVSVTVKKRSAVEIQYSFVEEYLVASHNRVTVRPYLESEQQNFHMLMISLCDRGCTSDKTQVFTCQRCLTGVLHG